MKTNFTLLTIAFFLIATDAPAQFLKKLGNKVSHRVEESVTEKIAQKTADKVAQQVDKNMEKMFNFPFGKGKAVDPALLPDAYTFDWTYTLEMKSKEGDIKFHYFLTQDGNYFASRPETGQSSAMGDMLMVMDNDLKATAMLFSYEDQKMGTVMSMDMDEVAEEAQETMDDYTFTELGTKEILGYTCQGFQMENDKHIIVSYVMPDAPVSFNAMGQGGPKNMPQGMDPKWIDQMGNGLMMEMEYTEKKKKKQTMTMTCVALKQEPMKIKTTDYDFSSLSMFGQSAQGD